MQKATQTAILLTLLVGIIAASESPVVKQALAQTQSTSETQLVPTLRKYHALWWDGVTYQYFGGPYVNALSAYFTAPGG